MEGDNPSTSEAGVFSLQATHFPQHGLGLPPQDPAFVHRNHEFGAQENNLYEFCVQALACYQNLGKQRIALRRKWHQMAFEVFPQVWKWHQMAFEVFPQFRKRHQMAFEPSAQFGKYPQIAFELSAQFWKWPQIPFEPSAQVRECPQIVFEPFARFCAGKFHHGNTPSRLWRWNKIAKEYRSIQ